MSTTTIEKKTATQTPAKAKSIRKKAVAAPMNPPAAPAGRTPTRQRWKLKRRKN